jgi:hypothetical protein
VLRLLDLPNWAIALLILAGFIAWQIVQRWLERRKQAWPVVEGTVTEHYVLGEGNPEMERTPDLCYSYDVNGQHYFGAQEIYEVDFDAYPRGSQIMVHYNPSDPSVSRLDLQNMRAREDALDANRESANPNDSS